ncbi:hypothetical protein [Streptomyces syringium]|uniref:hypothetical protein n=1 Tax=Streptomyces syringium TaxID=76729 RepID=UPI003AAB8D81
MNLLRSISLAVAIDTALTIAVGLVWLGIGTVRHRRTRKALRTAAQAAGPSLESADLSDLDAEYRRLCEGTNQ